MERDLDQVVKHMCKFCSKVFPCGRSLGGHMRTHLITVPSSDHRSHPKKKLPPLVVTNAKKIDSFMKKKKPNRFSKSSLMEEDDTLLEEKLCKECGKRFQSWKALFGHMKSHSDSSWTNNTSNDDHDDRKVIVDSNSDNEGSPNPVVCRMKKKRSERTKRYISNTNNTNSSSISTSNFSPCVSEIDQQEQEELVAMSLIMLSRDTTGNNIQRAGFDSIVESSDNSSKILDKDSKNKDCLKFKKLKNGELEPTILNSEKSMKKQSLEFKSSDLFARNGLKANKFDELRVGDVSENKNLDCNESEVNSSKNLINKNKSTRKRKSSMSIDAHDSELSEEFEKKSKFRCIICKKPFSSYQALGGHRASHKKFNGLCAPTTENSLEIEYSPSLIGETMNKGVVELKKDKDHECPICYRVFASGQALGGHKRSHLIGDVHAKSITTTTTTTTNSTSPSLVIEKQIPETRNFLDLNMPAPADEECNDFKTWWIGTSNEHEQEALVSVHL